MWDDLPYHFMLMMTRCKVRMINRHIRHWSSVGPFSPIIDNDTIQDQIICSYLFTMNAKENVRINKLNLCYGK